MKISRATLLIMVALALGVAFYMLWTGKDTPAPGSPIGSNVSDRPGNGGGVIPPEPATSPENGRKNTAERTAAPGADCVAGTVRFVAGNRPASGVEVVALRMDRGPEIRTTSDNEGRYVMANLLPNVDYYLAVDDPGAGHVALECPHVRLKGDQSLSGVDILLSSGASVSGVVCYRANNKPIPDSRVVLHDFTSDGYVRREALTDQDGKFEMEHLPAGPYYLECRPPKGVTSEIEGKSAAFYHVKLDPDAHLDNVTMSFYQPVEVAGRVLGPKGPVAGAKLSTICGGDCARVVAETDTTGAYALTGLTGGTEYRISVIAEGCWEMAKRVQVGEKNIAGVDFLLGSEGVLSGRVLNEARAPLPLCTVFVMFLSEESPNWPPEGYDASFLERSAAADASGCFRVENLPPGTYDFAVTRPGPADTDRLPCLTPPVSLGPGQKLTDIEIVMPNFEDQFIEGHVRNADGKPLEGVKVAASPNTEDLPRDRAETDARGYYRLDGLGDEPLDVWFACPDGQSLRLRGVPVGTTDADVTFGNPRGTIAGTVVDAATGKPVSEFTLSVAVQLLNSWVSTSPVSSGGDGPGLGEKGGPQISLGPNTGQFKITGVYPGVATLRVNARGYSTEDFGDIVVVSDRVTSGVRLALSPGSVFEGYILMDKNGGLRVRRMIIRPLNDLPAVETVPVDEDGYFRIDDLDPGTYNVRISFETADGKTTKIERDVEISRSAVTTESFQAPDL